MKCILCVIGTSLGLAVASSKADPPGRSTNAELITDFMAAADGVLDSPGDLLLDANPCDPDQPDVLDPVLAPDGHQLTLGEISQVRGWATIKCNDRGARIKMKLAGLIPGGVYTIWLLTFDEPGFTPDFAHLVGEGSSGSADGSNNSFVASPGGRAALSVRQPIGALSEFGEVTDCLFDEFEFHLVGAYHPNGLTYGPTPGPVDVPNPFCYFVEQFGFVFQSPPPPTACAADSAPQCVGGVEGQSCSLGVSSGSCVGAPACTCRPNTGAAQSQCCVYFQRGGGRVYRCRSDGSCPFRLGTATLGYRFPVDRCAECR